MGKLVPADVRKCFRVLQHFENLLEKQMKRGLVDGRRLRPEQFQAMRDRDTAFRIYRSARQKLKRDGGLEEVHNPLSMDGEAIPQEITPVTDDMFSGWVKEVQDEAWAELIEKKRKKEEEQRMRRQEAETRKLTGRTRSAVVAKLVELTPYDKDMVGRLLAEQLELQAKRDSGNDLVCFSIHPLFYLN
jgi:hypothetical protein